MSEKLSFLKMFSAFRPDAAFAAELADVLVVSAAIDAKARTLEAVLECPRDLGALLPRLEMELAAAFKIFFAATISSTGSADRETRMVSPTPIASRPPMPMADFKVPISTVPASVTPRCKG